MQAIANLECGPAYRTATGIHVFSRYADVAEIARDATFAAKDATWFDTNVPGWRDSAGMRLFCSCMLFHNGQSHQRLRKAMSGAFTPARLRFLREVAHRTTARQLDVLAASNEADLHQQFTLPVTRATGCALVGVSEEDGPRLYELVQPFLALLDPDVGIRTVARADRAAGKLRPYLDDLIADRRSRPRDDLASLVATLGDDEAASALLLALAAGFDTTITLLDNAISALIADRELGAAVAAELPGVVDAVVNETLRHTPPIPAFTRIATRDVTVGGVRLVAGQEVMALVTAAHRDPERFPDPETFDASRPATPLFAFSGGPHFCLGAQLAKLEASAVLPALLRRFPTMRPAGERRKNDRVTVRGWTSFPVVLHPPGEINGT